MVLLRRTREPDPISAALSVPAHASTVCHTHLAHYASDFGQRGPVSRLVLHCVRSARRTCWPPAGLASTGDSLRPHVPGGHCRVDILLFAHFFKSTTQHRCCCNGLLPGLYLDHSTKCGSQPHHTSWKTKSMTADDWHQIELWAGISIIAFLAWRIPTALFLRWLEKREDAQELSATEQPTCRAGEQK
jgi:hypothetical protein